MDILSYKLGKGAGGGGSADLDWTLIGFNSRPKSITDGYNYALSISNNWTTRVSIDSLYANNKELMFFPVVDTSTTTSMKYAFQNCYALVEIGLIDTSKIAAMQQAFDYCYSLKRIPQLDTGNVQSFQKTFEYCKALKDVPVLDTSSATNMTGTFTGCDSLTNESLNNILKMCINATKITGTNKTLAKVGLTSGQATICQGLSNYQDFIDAGWTTGY